MPADTESPRYHVAHWRNPETIQEEEVLSSFLDWLRESYDDDILLPSEFHQIELFVDEYLQHDEQKIKQGESELLENWIKSVKETK